MEDTIELIKGVIIIAGILDLILLIKIWRMTDDIREMKYELRKVLNNVRIIRAHSYFKYGQDECYEAFEEDMNEIEELIFCDRLDEARYRLKRLVFNINKVKEANKDAGYNDDQDMIKKMEERIASTFKRLEK